MSKDIILKQEAIICSFESSFQNFRFPKCFFELWTVIRNHIQSRMLKNEYQYTLNKIDRKSRFPGLLS